MQEVVAVVTVNHPQGLHLRSGKEIVRLAGQYESTVTARNVTRDSPVADARSILQLMQLQARQGHQLLISAEGSDAAEAVVALCALLEHLPE
jgi:phosphotransferase system HPr (HPr) family protein